MGLGAGEDGGEDIGGGWSPSSSSGGGGGGLGLDGGLANAAAGGGYAAPSGGSGGGPSFHDDDTHYYHPHPSGHRGNVQAWNNLFKQLGKPDRFASPSNDHPVIAHHNVPSGIGEFSDAGLHMKAAEAKKNAKTITTTIKAPEANPPSARDNIFGKQKSLLDAAENKLASAKLSLEQEIGKDRRIKNPAVRFASALETSAKAISLGVAEFGVGTARLISDVIHDPLKAGQEFIGGFEALPGQISNAVEQFAQGNPLPADELAGNIAAGFVAGEAIRASGVTEYAPRPAFAQVVSMGGDLVEEPKVEPVRYGVTISALKKPLVTIAKTDEGWKAALGALPAPSDAIEGRVITAFSPIETEFFKATLREHAPEPVSELFETGYRIADKIYKTKKPVTNPDEFIVLSSHIPDEAKAPVKEAIKAYKGDLEVYGSVAQKLQMQGWMSREPKDLEIKVDNPRKFVDKLKSLLDEAGIQYRIEGDEEKPKVYFKTESGWEKGIEIFKKGAKPFSADSPYKTSYPIQYGFKNQRPLDVEGIDMMRLSEQAARKLAGGHVYDAGDQDVVPVHEGRWKDVNDLIEIGTAYAKGKGLPIEEDVVKYTELQKELHPDKISSPIADFIAREGRLPEPDEVKELVGDLEVRDKELLFKKESGGSISAKEFVEDLVSVPAGEVSDVSPASMIGEENSWPSFIPESVEISKNVSKGSGENDHPSWPSWPSNPPSWLPSWPSWFPHHSGSRAKGSKGDASWPSWPSRPSNPPSPSTPSPPSSMPSTPSTPSTPPHSGKPSVPTITPGKEVGKAGILFPGQKLKRRRRAKPKDEKDWLIPTDITPLADWWAMTYTQALVGIRARSPYRFDAKKRWKKDLTTFGFGLSFPTRFIEKHRIRTYLDTTIKKAGELDIVTGKRAKRKINRAKKLKISVKDAKIGFGSGKQLEKVMKA